MNDLLPDIDELDRIMIEDANLFLRSEFPDGLNRVDLRRVNSQRGVDFATALLYAHFKSKLSDDCPATSTSDVKFVNNESPVIAIAPGAFYEEYPKIGADGREIAEVAERRNWSCERISTTSLGTLDDNAAKIIQWFDARESSNFVLVSLSKGAADVKIALEKRPDLWHRIRAWICVSGILHGTGIANWLLERKRLWLTTTFILWYRHLQRESLVELRHGRVSTRLGSKISERSLDVDAPVRDPIQIVGFPLRRHLSCWRSRLWHRRFRNDGPNDSVILLEDVLDQPGTVVPIWGADHYMKSSFEPSKLIAHIIDSVTRAKTISLGVAELAKQTAK